MDEHDDLKQILDKVLDIAVSQYYHIHEQSTIAAKSDIKGFLATEYASTGIGFDKTCIEILEHLRPAMSSPWSSRYFGLVTGGVTPAAMVADWMVTLFDNNLILDVGGDTASNYVERQAIQILLGMFKLKGFTGTLSTGATASNVAALAAAREWVGRERFGKSIAEEGGLDGIKVIGAAPHSSIVKATSLVGIGRRNIVSVSKDAEPDQVDINKLKMALENAKGAIVVITMAEVNTGSFPPSGQLREIRALCNTYKAWLHVDAAFGIFARCVNSELAMDLELADSITGDGHKYLNVPYDCGLFFIKQSYKPSLVDTFGTQAAYLASSGSDSLHGQDLGIENSRRFRALPVYATLRAYGTEGYKELVHRTCAFARNMSKWINDSEKWETLADCNFCVVLFRATKNELQTSQGNKDLIRRINASRKMYVTGTEWLGKPAIRCAIVNWSTSIKRDWPVVEQVLSSEVIYSGL